MTSTRTQIRRIVAAGVILGWAGVGLGALPGEPEKNGVAPTSATVYINTPDIINNGKTESLGIAIAKNGNVVVGWEDDGSDLTDLEAVWTLLDPTGKLITPDTEVTSGGASLTTKFLSYFRKDGSAVPGATSWGPKIKANLYGDGFGMGATSFGLGAEVPEFADIQNDAGGGGDFPSVQLLDNVGNPKAILSGVTDAHAETAGDIRIGDWDYLSNGNIVIVGESRQKTDLSDKFGGSVQENHAIYRIVDPTGKEIKAVGLLSSEPEKAEIWHGVGTVKDGFAVRFARGTPKIRFFGNDGAPKGADVDIATVTGKPITGNGGRGDGVGFHGNGVDRYVLVNSGTDAESGAKQVWVTVFRTDGTVVYSKSVIDDLTLTAPDRVDAAIDEKGRVVVAFDDPSGTDGNARIVLARLLRADGTPMGGTFYVSENEPPSAQTLEGRRPRVAFRNDRIAIAWESNNSGTPETRVVATRLFVVPIKIINTEAVGLQWIVKDTPLINQGLDSLGNWEPNVSSLGNTHFLVEGNAFAKDTTDKQRYVVGIQPAAGGAGKLVEGFYSDDGKPFDGEINASRQNGNPGRVAGDQRPGAVNYAVGAEASPHVYPQFQSDNRWNLGFDRLGDGRYGTVQTFKLDTATLTPTALSKAQDIANGRRTSGAAPGNQITRFGGDLVGLDNGNFAVAVEDRSLMVRPDGNAAVAAVISPDGKIVKDTFLVANGDLWSNIAAYQGGFAVRVAGNLYFYDNAGNLKGSVDQNTSGESFDRGRGDGTRIAGHINSPYVFLAGKVSTAPIIRVAAFDSRDQKFVAVADVSEGGFTGDFDRANITVDAYNRVVVGWVAKPLDFADQQVAVRVLAFDGATKSFNPLTQSFLPFVNAAGSGAIRTLQMSLATTTKQILVAAKGEINLANKPADGATSPRELNFYTVISHPDPKEWTGGGAAGPLAIKKANGKWVLEWTSGVLQTSDDLGKAFTDVPNATSPRDVNPTDGRRYWRLR